MLADYLNDKAQNSVTQQEIEDLAEKLIEEIFVTEQKNIDEKIALFV